MKTKTKKKTAKKTPTRTKKTKNGKKIGRPLAKISEARVAKLARTGCHVKTIADLIGVNETTLRDRFPETIAKNRALHRLDVRLAQKKLLDEGSVAMAIFLGKALLNQSDRLDVTSEGERLSFFDAIGLLLDKEATDDAA